MKLRKCKYKSVVKAAVKFEPWDYGFILDMERAALEKMRDYIRDKGVHVDNIRDSERINLTLRLLDISMDKYLDWEKIDQGIIYVNTKNKYRYFRKDKLSEKCFDNISKSTLREEKAWYLYCKMREYWFRTFWD